MKKKNWYYVIALEPIRIQKDYAPQNDSLNLSFVKDLHVVGKIKARNGCKMAIYVYTIFSFFLQKKWVTKNFVFYVISFDSIKI